MYGYILAHLPNDTIHQIMFYVSHHVAYIINEALFLNDVLVNIIITDEDRCGS